MSYAFFRSTLFPLFLKNVKAVEGLEHIPHRGPFVIAANHVSYIEPAIIGMLVNRVTHQKAYSLTKDGVWQLFHKLGLADFLGMVHVEPGQKERCIGECLKKLQQGYPVVIFPEGTRNPSPALLKAKTGVARLALLSGVPIIPVGYRGPPGMTTGEAIRNTFGDTKSITVRVGNPLTFPKQVSVHEHARLEEVAKTIMRAIAPLCKKNYPF